MSDGKSVAPPDVLELQYPNSLPIIQEWWEHLEDHRLSTLRQTQCLPRLFFGSETCTRYHLQYCNTIYMVPSLNAVYNYNQSNIAIKCDDTTWVYLASFENRYTSFQSASGHNSKCWLKCSWNWPSISNTLCFLIVKKGCKNSALCSSIIWQQAGDEWKQDLLYNGNPFVLDLSGFIFLFFSTRWKSSWL